MAQRQISLDSSHTESPPVDRYAWVILFVVFLVSVAAPLNMSKVPPLMAHSDRCIRACCRVFCQGPLRTLASPLAQPFRPVIEIPWMK
jgi:hypothetical protein